MMELTKERLTALSNRENVGAICSDEIVAMARQLLARLEQEPVAWTTGVYRQNIGCNFGEKVPGEAPCIAAVYWDRNTFKHDTDCQETSDRWLAEAIKNTGAKPLYAAPQLPQPAVPDYDALRLAFEATERKSEYGFNLHKYGIGYADKATQLRCEQWVACRAAMLQGAEPVSQPDELPLDYLQGHKDGLEWAARMAEANHPQTGDWLYDHPLELAKAIRKGPDMPTAPVQGWIPCSERMPEEVGRYWCYVEEQNSLGESHYQWNCSWNGDRWWVESENGGRVTHWMPLPASPQQEADNG